MSDTPHGGWRDIESTPRDGTRILLGLPDRTVRDGWWDGEVGLVPDPIIDTMVWRGAWVDGELVGPFWDLYPAEYHPVVWQPLPAPPETENG